MIRFTKGLLVATLLAGVLAVAACGDEDEVKSFGEQLQEIETGRKDVRQTAGQAKSFTKIDITEGPQEFTVTTVDDWEISGTYYRYDGNRTIPIILMLHEEGSSREDWRSLSEFLWDAGFGVVNIDFRGHGASTTRAGEQVTHEQFTDEDWRGLVTDARAVLEYIQTDAAVDIIRFGIFGSKIGGNVAIKVLQLEDDLRAAFVVNAQPSYQGIDISEDIVLREEQNILVLAGTEPKADADFARLIYDTAITTRKRLEIYETSLKGMELVNEMRENGHVVAEAQSSWGVPSAGPEVRRLFDKFILDFVIRNI